MSRPHRKLTVVDYLQMALALVIAAPVVIFFLVPWLAWVLQFFPAR